MSNGVLFCNLTSKSIADFIRSARHSICYAGPGIQTQPAQAIVDKTSALGVEMITVCLDFDEKVMRMGYGDIVAVKSLHNAGIIVNHSPGLRNALIIVDNEGYIYTPTALFLETESENDSTRNALRLSRDQVSEALARLSPAAKIIAIAQAKSIEEKNKISAIPVEVNSNTVDAILLTKVENTLKETPPVQFDIARQVRVFAAHFQYVELKLTGAAIQRRKLTIPADLLELDEKSEIKNRLHTTFDLIPNDSDFSSKPIEDKFRLIKKGLTRNLGKGHGLIVLKKNKQHLVDELKNLSKELKEHGDNLSGNLQIHIENSRLEVIKYYISIVMDLVKQKKAPMTLIGASFNDPPSEDDVEKWLTSKLKDMFPNAEELIKKMEIEEYYKDVTFEALSQNDFQKKIEKAYPDWPWNMIYNEFQSMGEATK